MNIVVSLLAPIALLAPFPLDGLSGPGPYDSDAQTVSHGEADANEDKRLSRTVRKMPDWIEFAPAQRIEPARQVRIERRVIIRISPRPPAERQRLLRELPRSQPVANYVERKLDECLSTQGIIGVQPSGEHSLRLFLRDRRMINLRLAKSCPAQTFYSGFYVERHDDGKLCARRDLLHSRSGTKCSVAAMSELVPVTKR
ncbi:hypothetical protein GRI38_05755 [Altererythrobacter aurantiacus]|uniref:Uncharacterized protein n=1 Tax=Parapontixanthobacter aurantiacus TaxID=1463599 RepID=A0A844ZAD7_9SPHN|nr:hypothetical protein [Parapontixanthobacter aurantiacus]MXO85531.1 hypothetical protein [Parapontixanthobacter aurantiacus]